MTSVSTAMFNRLCYYMITATRPQQRLVMLLVGLLSIAFVSLQYAIFTEIFSPLTYENIAISTRDIVLDLTAIMFYLIAYLGLRRLLMIIDNPISNPACNKMGYACWSLANISCFLIMLSSVFNLIMHLPIFALLENNSVEAYIIALASTYVSMVIASPFIVHLLLHNDGSLNLSSTLFKCFFVTPEPVFSFMSERDYIRNVVRGEHNAGEQSHPSFRYMLYLHDVTKRLVIKHIAEGEVINRTHDALIKNADKTQRYWLTLSYLLTHQWPLAGRTIQNTATPPARYLIPEHQHFFTLHMISEDERFAQLKADAEKVDSDTGKENSLARFMQTWNLTPYYFIDHANPDIRQQAMEYMGKGQYTAT